MSKKKSKDDVDWLIELIILMKKKLYYLPYEQGRIWKICLWISVQKYRWFTWIWKEIWNFWKGCMPVE